MDKQTKKPAQVWHRKHTGDFAIAAIASYPKCVCGYVFHPLKRFSEQTPPTDIFCITIYHRQRKFIGRIMRYRCVLEDCVWRFWAPSRWEMVVYIVEFKCNKSWACRQTSEDTFTYFCFPLAHFLNHLTTLRFLLFCNSPRDNHFLFGTILVRWWVHRTEKQNKQKNQTVQHVGKMKHMRKKNLTFSHVGTCGTAVWRCQSHPQPNTSWGGFNLDFKQKNVRHPYFNDLTPTLSFWLMEGKLESIIARRRE